MAVKIGIYLPAFSLDMRGSDQQRMWVDNLKKYIQRCDELDFDIWGVDHLLTAKGLYGQTWLDPLTLLSFAAGQTERAMLGTGILVAPLRDPVLLAKEIASLARLSNNRFILGAGAGWDPAEFSAVGAHISERGKRLDEVVEATRLLLSQEGVTYHGQYYSFDDVTIAPRPLSPVPVWASGGSRLPDPAFRDKSEMPRQVLKRIGAADAWISRCSGNQELLLRDMDTVRVHLAEIGRDVASLRFAHCNFIHIEPEATHAQALDLQKPLATAAFGTHRTYEHLQECYLLGSLDHQLGRVKELAAAGVDYFILGPLSQDITQLDLIHDRIAGALG